MASMRSLLPRCCSNKKEWWESSYPQSKMGLHPKSPLRQNPRHENLRCKTTWKCYGSSCVHSASPKCQELLGNRHRGEVLKWWHIKSRETNLCVRHDDNSALTETQSSCWAVRRFHSKCYKAGHGFWEWIKNEWRRGFLNQILHFGWSSGFLVEAVWDLPCMCLWEQLENLDILTTLKFVKHDTFIQTWWSHCFINHKEISVEVPT